ncbi:MAG: DUF6178 family protein [Thermodesulfobacteriota bacterium]
MPHDNIVSLEKLSLQKLPASQLHGRLMTLPARDRLEVILGRGDGATVVGEMASQDLYLTVKELSPESSLPLLSMATTEQITYILDIEAWSGDLLQAGSCLRWLETLLDAGEQPFLNWLHHADFELLVTLFKQLLDTAPPDLDEGERQDAPQQETIDGVHFFSIRYPAHRETVLNILRYLFETYQPFYQELFAQLLLGNTAEMEELAYRFHAGRLADHGIPDRREAATILFSLDEHQVRRDKVFPEISGVHPPTFALIRLPEGELFRRALQSLGPAAASLQEELTGLANKIMVADRLAPDSPDDLRFAVDKAIAGINLGLDILSGSDPGQAGELLQQVFLEDLFRLAQTRTRAALRPLITPAADGWQRRWPHGINLLDDPWLEQASLFVSPTPFLVRQETEREDFLRTGTDLDRAALFCATVTAAGGLLPALEARHGARFWERFRLWRHGQHPSLESVTLGGLLFTAAAGQLLTGSPVPEPLPREDWASRQELLQPAALVQALLDLADTLLPPADREKGRAYLLPIIERYRREPAVAIDPKLSPFFLFAGE